MTRALYSRVIGYGTLGCALCPHMCEIGLGQSGLCSARRNENYVLCAESYGRVTSLALDPIEKKPLRCFHPGAMILSAGSYGCNMRCAFCQNHEISTGRAPSRKMMPDELAALSLEYADKGSIGVAYTYNEPLVGYEFVLDCAKLVRAQGQKNVLVTNGLINEQPLRGLLPLVDALNIDLKCFSESYYMELGGDLETVKSSIEMAAEACHVEVTTLIVPGKNDSPGEMAALSSWLAGVDPNIPLHLSRFFPRHNMTDAEPTPAGTLRALEGEARKHLSRVYLGNV